MSSTRLGNEHARTSNQFLPLSSLLIDPRVQRAWNQSWSATIARDFDPGKLGVIHVSLRKDGNHYIIDGQHRAKAAELWLGADCNGQKVECRVYEGLSLAEEAELFVALNTAKKVGAIAKYPGGPASLVGTARGMREITGSTVGRAVAEVIVEHYNKGRRVGKIESLR